MNTHSIDLVQTEQQFLSIDASSQCGLDLALSFTIEAWVCLASLPSSSNIFPIVTKHDHVASTGGYEFYLNQEDKMVVEFGDDDSHLTMATCDEKINDERWHHVAVIVEVINPNITFFIDGVKQKTIIQSEDAHSIQKNSFPFLVGASLQNEQVGNYFDGQIDELRVWNKVKDELELIKNIKVELKGDEHGLVGYWRFDESLDDTTGNTNTLVAHNDPVFVTDVPFGGRPPEQKILIQSPSHYGTFFG